MRVHVSLCRHVIRWRLCQGLLLRSISVRIFAKLNSRVRLPSFLFRVRHCACVTLPNPSPVRLQRPPADFCFHFATLVISPMTQNVTVLLHFPPRFLFCLFFVSFKCDRWQLNHFVWLVVILRSYLHMPILHCLWWKYLQCVTDTQNSLFVFCGQNGYRWTTHHCLSIPEGKSYKRWHVLYQSIETFCLGGGGVVNACDDFISSDCTFWWSIEI